MLLIRDMTDTEPSKAPCVDPPPTVWGLYNDKARFRDKALLKDWDSSINSLLLFAAIFAAVLTALCVESRKLLEQDPLNLIDQTLLYMVQRSIDPSIAPLPPRESFEPPKWAVIVNAFFFASLTTSILAAVGAVTCLQWVDEYDAGLDAAATPKERAIRSHYRYRATRRWYMRHMIASLPIILYLAVGFFLIGLALWFWQIYTVLALIPLASLLIWATAYTATTLMAVFYPSAPYRTAVSKALFRVIYLGRFYAWYYTRKTLSLYKPLLKFLRHIFSRDLWKESRNQYILEKIEFSRRMKPKDLFPWMPPGRDVHQSTHSHIREQGSVSRDETIHISTLAWLASSTDLSENSAPKLHLVLAELNNLPQSKLRHWPEHNYDAPWSQIFEMVLAPSIKTKEKDVVLHQDGQATPKDKVVRNDEIIWMLAQILQKMSLHPTLFDRMILDLDNVLLIKFMDLLGSKRPTSSTEAQRRLKSITLLVSSKKWLRMPHEEQPTMQAFKVILDCLDSMQISGDDPHISTSWIFTFCYVKKTKGDKSKMVTWPKPALIRFIPNAFTNKSLREQSIIFFLHFIDAVLCDSEPTASIEWRWKWTKDSRSRLGDGSAAKKHVEDKLVVMRLLVHHLLRIFFTFSESRQSNDLFNDLVSQGMTSSGGEKITNPALRLVVIAFGGHLEDVEVPPHDDRIWSDPVWQYAVSVWFGFQTDYAVSNGREIFDLVRPEESAKLVEAFRNANLPAFNRLIKLSTQLRSSKYLRFWNRLFALAPNSACEISRTFSSPVAGLQEDQWFQIFTDFQSEEGPCTPNSVTIAMLEALKGSIRTALCQTLWKKYIETQVQVSPSAPPTPIARIIQLVTDVWQRERPNRQSGSLPLGMLDLTCNFIRNYRNNSNFQRLRICVYIVDELALAYTAGSLRDPRYTGLFLEISTVLEPICKHYIVQSSAAPLNDRERKALLWSAKLEDAFNNTSKAGGLSIKIDKTQAPYVGDVEMEYTPPNTPAKEGLLHRILTRTQTAIVEDKV